MLEKADRLALETRGSRSEGRAGQPWDHRDTPQSPAPLGGEEEELSPAQFAREGRLQGTWSGGRRGD